MRALSDAALHSFNYEIFHQKYFFTKEFSAFTYADRQDYQKFTKNQISVQLTEKAKIKER